MVSIWWLFSLEMEWINISFVMNEIKHTNEQQQKNTFLGWNGAMWKCIEIVISSLRFPMICFSCQLRSIISTNILTCIAHFATCWAVVCIQWSQNKIQCVLLYEHTYTHTHTITSKWWKKNRKRKKKLLLIVNGNRQWQMS